MSNIFINGLSLGSMSGAHVLFGHLEQLAHAARGQAEIKVLLQPGMSLPEACLLEHVEVIMAPKSTSHWSTRILWEMQSLPGIIRESGCQKYFTPAGTILPGCKIPQYSLAQNPWPMVPKLHRTWLETFKASQLRRAYRMAYDRAEVMIYNSYHMQDMYQRNSSGKPGGKWIVSYQGINEETFQDAKAKQGTERTPFSILSVSAMAHWKGAETLVRALGLLRAKDIPATVTFVGPWPDTKYLHKIESLIDELKIKSYVNILGKVSTAELQQHYASHQVYCLMSSCESFGIPAVEAQAYGTPVIGATGCAMPEIGGGGGMFSAPHDVKQAALHLEECLTKYHVWNKLSHQARLNAERFHWSECSKPLVVSLLNVEVPAKKQVAPAIQNASDQVKVVL